jgi:hypothetical protein
VVNVSDISFYPGQSIALVQSITVVFVVSTSQEAELIQAEHYGQNHTERAGHVTDSHAVWYVHHHGRNFDLFGHWSALPGPRFGSGHHAPNEVVPNVIQDFHQELQRPVRERFQERVPWFDKAIQGPA